MLKTIHSTYEKMPTSLKKIGLLPTDLPKLNKLQWVATEKIHGANFSFIYEQQQLKFAKRKAFLTWQDDFFGFQAVVAKIEHQIVALFEQLSKDIPAQQYVIYGELFGGTYPHPAVESDKNVQAIQTGIYYAPSIEFCAFDIAIIEDKTIPKYYLDYQTALAYFEQYDLLHAQALKVGTLNELLSFDIQINSTLAQKLHLPEIHPNFIEGIVVKPFQHLSAKFSCRPIFKIKNPNFEENPAFHQAQKWSYLPDVTAHSEDLTFLLEAIQTYINTNRLDSAISKIGQLDVANAKRMIAIEQECVADILHDFNEMNEQILKELTVNQKDWLTQRVVTSVQKIINAYNDSSRTD